MIAAAELTESMKRSARALPERALSALQEFFRLEAAGGLLLVVAAALALLCANTALQPRYDALLQFPIELRAGSLQLAKPLLLWINDGLMALFFLLVALEIKREAVRGQLATRASRVLPLACAFGGVLVPAAIYVALNHHDARALRGWAIPTATDIAFALGMLSLLGSRVPLALKLLLSAIAVIDDLAAIVIIAAFYTDALSWPALAGAGATLGLLFALNRLGVRRVSVYLLVGVVLWVCVLKSGVHATLAGVATGLAIPLGAADDPDDTPLESLEHALHPWVAFAILPLFAFANAGVPLAGVGLAALRDPVTLGIALGLLLAKPIGVFGVGWSLQRLRGTPSSQTLDARALFGVALLCGIGFTMSLFIGALAFGVSGDGDASSMRLGILLGSVLAALGGLAWLHRTLPRVARA
jgi:Na+:H+ antiporter, NhaA family